MDKLTAALDTSLGFSLCLGDENGNIILQERLPAVGRESDRLLVPWLQECMTKANTTLSQVGKWSLGIGPGSFAGLRCGIAAVKGVALSSGAVLRGVPSAYALVCALPEGAVGEILGSLHDGRCGEVLLARFQRQADGALKMLSAPEALPPEALLAPENACARYVTVQPEILPLCPGEVKGKTLALEGVLACCLLKAPCEFYPWPKDAAEQEKSTEPLYVRQAVFVAPATLRR